jgi:hypothetical protein
MRPARELVSDDVQGQLQSTATMLKGTMDKLHRCLKSTEIDISRLSESKLALQMDLTNKHGAMTVDTQVLNDDQGQMINAKGAIRKVTPTPLSFTTHALHNPLSKALSQIQQLKH